MELQEILSQLTHYTGTFPEEAVRAAIQRSELIIPDLLIALEEVADNPEKLNDPYYMLPTYAFYLLAQFKEERAYPLLVKLFSTPGDFVLEATGDFVTEDLGRVLASVCGVNIAPIKKMIEDTSIDEYVRSAGLSAITVLVAENKLDREKAIAYFNSLFKEKLEQEQNEVWSSLVCSCCDLGPYDLITEIKNAFSKGLVDSMVVDFEYVMSLVNNEPEYRISRDYHRYKFIGNVVDEMSWWNAFTEKDSSSILWETSSTKPKSEKVGRNDPCPCGSGKKYKRCCLH